MSTRCRTFVCVMPLPLLRGSERASRGLNRDRLVRPAARPRARPGGCPSPSGPHTGTGRRQRGARCRAPGQHGQVVSQRLGVARDVHYSREPREERGDLRAEPRAGRVHLHGPKVEGAEVHVLQPHEGAQPVHGQRQLLCRHAGLC
ncbi:unnamed protein product [Prorocentrum cordatum]|uniref:Uncharacterized protein n=1 Tax=Prorocentrum cordatum TaxID=2364126 RepID=A0ABN9PBU6_9DINO|nr:unnamed protein product [Polarella glacialis]